VEEDEIKAEAGVSRRCSIDRKGSAPADILIRLVKMIRQVSAAANLIRRARYHRPKDDLLAVSRPETEREVL
jgi:hypothetical protein